MACPDWSELLQAAEAQNHPLQVHLRGCAACRLRLQGHSRGDSALRGLLLCPEPEELARLLEGGRASGQLEGHLKLCAACAGLLELREGVETVSARRQRQLLAKLDIAPAPRRRRPRRALQRRPAWGLWAAAAAIILALGTWWALPPGEPDDSSRVQVPPAPPPQPQPQPQPETPPEPQPEGHPQPQPELQPQPEAQPQPDQPEPQPDPEPHFAEHSDPDPEAPPATETAGWQLLAGGLLDAAGEPALEGSLTAAPGMGARLERAGQQLLLEPGSQLVLAAAGELRFEAGRMQLTNPAAAPQRIQTELGEVEGAFAGALAVEPGRLLLSVLDGEAAVAGQPVLRGQLAAFDGRELALLGQAEPAGFAIDAVEVEALALAEARALRFLRESALPSGGWSGAWGVAFPSGLHALVLRALWACGVRTGDPLFDRGLRRLREAVPQRVVEAALVLELYASMYAPPEREAAAAARAFRRSPASDRKLARQALELLAVHAIAGGWSYPGRGVADSHNRSTALLGLEAAARLGLRLPEELAELGLQSERAAQRSDGAWSYLPGEGARGSSTAGALLALVRWQPQDAAQRAACGWLLKHAEAADHPGYSGHWLYTWRWRLSEVSREAFCFDPWRADVLRSLLQDQLPDGRFESPLTATGAEREDSLVSTAYALLMLASDGIAARALDDEAPAGARLQSGTLFLRYAPPAGVRTVAVAGSFNGWQPQLLADPDRDGIFELELEVGEACAYKLVLNGQHWLLDPWNPRAEDDGRGNLNSVLD